jgi:hypothetical protein
MSAALSILSAFGDPWDTYSATFFDISLFLDNCIIAAFREGAVTTSYFVLTFSHYLESVADLTLRWVDRFPLSLKI